MATADQSSALQDAMARAKEIAAELKQQGAGSIASAPAEDESRKLSLDQKEPATDDSKNQKALATQVAQTLERRAALGTMFREEFYIPNRMVSLVIGKDGEMIVKLESESNAKIQVAPDPPAWRAHEDRQLTLTGTPEAVGYAKKLMEKIVAEGKVPDSFNLKGSGKLTIELMIPSAKFGLLMGTHAETIHHLEEQSNCVMVMIKDGIYENQDEKLLRITGEKEKCAYAKQLVIDMLTDKPLQASNMTFGPQQDGMNRITIEYPVPMESVSYVIGKRGETIKNIEKQTQCELEFKNEVEDRTKFAVLTGTREQIDAAIKMIDEIVENVKNGNFKGERSMERPQLGSPPGGQVGLMWGDGGPSGDFQQLAGRMPQTPLQPDEKKMDCVPNFCMDKYRPVPEAAFRVYYEEKSKQAESFI